MTRIPAQVGVEADPTSLCNPPIKIVAPKGGVTIGKYCAFGPRLAIVGVGHDYNFAAIQGTLYRQMFAKEHPVDHQSKVRSKGPIEIGSDVWIGQDVTILSGVTIGDGAIIGLGSIVTRHVPPYAVFAGVPASFVKWRFEHSVRDFLLNVRWWDWPGEKIKANEEFFSLSLSTMTVEEIRKVIR